MGFLGFILMLVILSAIVAFLLAAFIRSNALAIIASIIIAEAIALLVVLGVQSDSPYPETAMLGVSVTAFFGTPIIIVSAIGFTLLARRVFPWKNS
jgi:hypothetical protein